MSDATPGAGEILALIEPRFGSPERARAWFAENPLPGFGGLTAKQMVSSSRGAEVRDFLAAVDAGVYS